ncbi:MAG: GIY-YIG nuclease family protein [Methanobrevibacter sp.]|nr:GIY-YIG nuclease family protein [Methanobrevibacter sp.]
MKDYYGYVYIITNKIDGKSYIGQRTGQFDENYWGSGIYFKKIRDKIGKVNFERQILAYAIDEEDLNSLEFQMIEQFNTIKPNGYNTLKGGGVKNLDSTKKKISKSNTGKRRTKAQKDFIRKRTVEQMKKMQKPERLKSRLGAHWYTNGERDACLFECPEGWWRGRTQYNRLSDEQKKHLFGR